MNSGLYTRVHSDTREFLMNYNRNGLSYTFVMVHINLAEYQKYYGDSFKMYDQGWSPVINNHFETYIDDLIAAYLPAYRHPNLISAVDIINTAGNRYLSNLICATSQVKNVNIHNDINILSTLQYEKQSNSGMLIIAPDNIRQHLDIQLTYPVSIQDYKRARKLFEISEQNTYLVGNNRIIYGIITQQTLINLRYDSVLLIRIYGPLNWELFSYYPATNTNVSLMIYKDSRFQIKPSYNVIDSFKSAILSVCEDANIDVLIGIVESACGQMHGTTIVFSMDVESESRRLVNSSFPICPTSIEQITHQITSIDGAVLCDMSGMCFAIGTILDGLSTNNENISYGARHNSAKRYKAGHPNCVIVIVSEDGGITIL